MKPRFAPENRAAAFWEGRPGPQRHLLIGIQRRKTLGAPPGKGKPFVPSSGDWKQP
jgi:hypothetical protein